MGRDAVSTLSGFAVATAGTIDAAVPAVFKGMVLLTLNASTPLTRNEAVGVASAAFPFWGEPDAAADGDNAAADAAEDDDDDDDDDDVDEGVSECPILGEGVLLARGGAAPRSLLCFPHAWQVVNAI